MNQGTFSDYHGSGDSSDLYVYGDPFSAESMAGIFTDDDISFNYGKTLCSRLSWFSTLTTCKIIINLQLLQPYMVWLMSMLAILILIL